MITPTVVSIIVALVCWAPLTATLKISTLKVRRLLFLTNFFNIIIGENYITAMRGMQSERDC
jgi:hypothetical protein